MFRISTERRKTSKKILSNHKIEKNFTTKKNKIDNLSYNNIILKFIFP